jgi:hypothetical protein
MWFQLGYTLAKAMDNGPDALVVGRPGNVQNSYATQLEWGPSTTDQRNRFIAAWVAEPKFKLSNNSWNLLANNWKFSSVMTVGSGRPLNATIAGDPNGDSNTYNDRLPGYIRNAFVGPDYFSTDFRLTRNIRCGERVMWTVTAESFNLFNRTNSRVEISDDGFYNSAGQFVAYTTVVKGKIYPGMYLMNSTFLTPTNAYAPRQIQFAVRMSFWPESTSRYRPLCHRKSSAGLSLRLTSPGNIGITTKVHVGQVGGCFLFGRSTHSRG